MSNRPRPQVGPPPRHDDLRALPDPQLLDVAVQCQVRKNRDTAREIETYAEMRRRCESDYEVRRARGPEHFVITPLDETALELAGALHVDEHKIKLDLMLRDKLAAWFPLLWDRCLSGRLDIGRARIFVDNAEQLADPADIPELARMVEDYLERYDDPASPLVSITYRQLSNAIRYRRLKFEQKSAAQGFAEAFQKRSAWLRIDENGIGTLGASGAAHDLTACDYRLTLIARKRCQDPADDRTLEQMRADTLRDLILGRLTVTALDADLEADRTADGADPATTFAEHEVGDFARPVVHVTVPLSTLLGTSDEPGFLSGDHPVPADLLRLIAGDPSSTWYRLLTDDAGRFCDLSTQELPADTSDRAWSRRPRPPLRLAGLPASRRPVRARPSAQVPARRDLARQPRPALPPAPHGQALRGRHRQQGRRRQLRGAHPTGQHPAERAQRAATRRPRTPGTPSQQPAGREADPSAA